MIVNLVEQGQIQGIDDDGVTVFRGVPFAAPPTDERRWAPPQPPIPWDGVRVADQFGPACIQPTFDSMEGTEPIEEMSEDCLFLNVWTPEQAVNRSAKRPVMVWIHGGAFKLGEARSLLYSGGPLAHKGAVVVTLNYRLGFLGFFAHSALEREAPTGPANFAMLDQIAALNWVKKNIASFGGDPDNVTIFGESAGGMSVLMLMASPLAAGLFHKAIAQSAPALPERTREGARNLCDNVVPRAWGVPANATLQQLRDVPAEAFTRTHYPNPDGSDSAELIPSLAPCAIYGDGVLPKKVRVAFEDQTQHAVPLMIGSNSNEQSIALQFRMDPVLIYDALEAMPDGKTILAALKVLYANDDLEDGALADKSRFGGLIMRDLLFTMQARSLATWQAKRNQDAFRYYFKYVTEALHDERPHGVDHGDEIVYSFDTGDIAFGMAGRFSDNDHKIADAVSNYWFTFARDGKPTDARLGVAWNRHTLERPDVTSLLRADQIMVLDEEFKLWTNSFMVTRLKQYQEQYATIEPLIEAVLNGELPGR